jgi:hypothetical protein
MSANGSLYSNWKPRSTDSLEFGDLYEWGRDYDLRGPHKVPPYKRFWILEYQIPQALAYRGKEVANYAEGLAALIMNAFIFSGALKLPIFSYFKYRSVTEVPKASFDSMRILVLLGSCWQMIHYQQADSRRHKSRYNENKLAQSVANLIEEFCAYLPTGHEQTAIRDTTEILTQDIQMTQVPRAAA